MAQQNDSSVTVIPQDQIEKALLDAKLTCLRYRIPQSEIETLLAEIRAGYLS